MSPRMFSEIRAASQSHGAMASARSTIRSNEYDTWLVRDEVNFHRIGHDRTHSTLHGLTDDCVVPIAGAAPSEPVIDTTAVKTT